MVQGTFLGLIQPYVCLLDHLFLETQCCSKESGGSAAQLLLYCDQSWYLEVETVQELVPCGKVKFPWLARLLRDQRLDWN